MDDLNFECTGVTCIDSYFLLSPNLLFYIHTCTRFGELLVSGETLACSFVHYQLGVENKFYRLYHKKKKIKPCKKHLHLRSVI